MGVPSGITVHARHRDGAGRRHDRRQAARSRWQGGLFGACLTFAVWLLALPAAADGVRIALYHTELSRDGPGVLLRDMSRNDPQVGAVRSVIDASDADVLVLAGIDYDVDGLALQALNAGLQTPFPHLLALRPVAGVASGADLDGDGRLGTARDAWGYGRFPGAGGMAVLSRWPLGAVTDLSHTRWADLPGASPPDGMPPDLPVSSTGHWIVPVQAHDRSIALLIHHATPPVFDGPEDRNGRRNADEARLWAVALDGGLGPVVPDMPVVMTAVVNLDLNDGEGRGDEVAQALAHPRLVDVQPGSQRTGADPGHRGDPQRDTAMFDAEGPGGLRLDYVLPDRTLPVADAGVMWPAEDDPFLATVEAASRHRLVWVDLGQD
jgi:hypothetical protein